MTLKNTPLHVAHLALGARMVDFGGWDMPVNYGSQIEEHHAVRADCGMFDVSHMCVVDLYGAPGRAFLRTLIANNVDKLATRGKALYSCMLNREGGVIDDLLVYFFQEDWFRLVINAGTAEGDLKWIQEQASHSAKTLEIVPRRGEVQGALALVAVQGPNARAKTMLALPAAASAIDSLKPFNAVLVQDPSLGETMIARTGYTGEDGLEIAVAAKDAEVLWNTLLAKGVKPAGLGARDTLRLEAGMNLYGQDMNAHVSPLDAGLGWTVDLKHEREFIGRAKLVQNGIRHQFLGIILIDKGGVLRAHQEVLTLHGTGEITSGTFSPTMQQAIALARLPLNVVPGETVEVLVRDKKLRAKVVKLPFVRNGKILAT